MQQHLVFIIIAIGKVEKKQSTIKCNIWEIL